MNPIKYLTILAIFSMFPIAFSMSQNTTTLTSNIAMINSQTNNISTSNTETSSMQTTCTQTQDPNFYIDTFMCRQIDCEEIYINAINQAQESLFCAFFDFNLKDLNNAIKNKNIKKLIYVDGDNHDFNDSYIVYEDKSSYMHNKFCIIDNSITITGSFNPTINGKEKNDNNIVIIRSEQVAKIYTEYFKQLLREHNTDYKNRSTKNKNHHLQFKNTNISICFSRGGNCLNQIKKQLNKAQDSIHLMLFTMTDKTITNFLVLKHYNKTQISTIFEKSLITKYSSFHKLDFHEIPSKKDKNPGKLHHKVIIIDNSTVITGSFNPSQNADNNNDENMLIIHNKKIAEKYLNEFNKILAKCTI